MAIEDTAACWAPDELAERVQAVLDAAPAWRGWHTKILDDEGACGTVSQLTGTGARSVAGAFDPQHKLVLITHTEGER
jgi:hypothetical protein